MEKIPFMDLAAQYQSLESEINAAIRRVIDSRAFIHGREVEEFSREFLRVHGGGLGIGCANGTTAITVALRALGIGPGDEVLVPNHTFIATAEAVVEAGARPVLVEINENWRQMDLVDAKARLGPRTKALIAVHLYGLPEPMEEIMEFAGAHGLKVIEDCAQAQLARWNGKPVGTFGSIATFSFYPGKNLGAFGDAGFIMTGDAQLFDFIRCYVDHGRQDKYVHEFFGINARMDGMQAAVLGVKLRFLETWTERRRELARAYDELLSRRGFRVLKPHDRARAVYHLYVVEVANREEVAAEFKREGIGYGIHYPLPLNAQPAFAALGYARGGFPVSEKFAERIVSLPFFPEMTLTQLQTVADVLTRVGRP